MSGGVGPCSDISLPREEKQKILEDTQKPHQRMGGGGGRGGVLSFRQLNALAVVTILAASGMVSMESFAFVIFSLIYTYFFSKVAFPPTSPGQADPPVFTGNNRLLHLYDIIGAVIGLFLPVGYIFEGILEGDKQGIAAASPHVFLLASQVFMEGVASSGRFSIPVRVFVPVLYNSGRIFTIFEWVKSEVAKVDGGGGAWRRMWVGRGLAFCNMAFWCFNLFGFLLPVYLPRAFKIYYSRLKIIE